MNRRLNKKDILIWCLVLIWPSVASAIPQKHTVKTGESVSLICIEYYGRYIEAMGERIMELNPGINNINLVSAGFELVLIPEKEKEDIIKKEMAVNQAVVTYISGEAGILSEGDETVPLKLNSVLKPGVCINTGKDGRVEIMINTESVIRIGGSTRLCLKAFKEPGGRNSKTEVEMDRGSIWTKVRKSVSRLRSFSLLIPNAVAGVYGTVYNADVNNDKSSTVKVYEGEVHVKQRKKKKADKSLAVHEVQGPREVSMEEWTRIIRKMQMVEITGEGRPEKVKPFKEKEGDEWEDWNKQRDERLKGIISGYE